MFVSPPIKDFIYLNIQILNKKFKQILLLHLTTHRLLYISNHNTFLIRVSDYQLSLLLVLLKNFDSRKIKYSLKSDNFHKALNQAFLLDPLEEQKYLDIESQPKPIKKKGKKYKSWRKFNKLHDSFWSSRVLKKNFILKFFFNQDTFIPNNVLLKFISQKLKNSNKIISTIVKQISLIFFRFYLLILNFIFLRFFFYKLFFFFNAHNTSNLL